MTDMIELGWRTRGVWDHSHYWRSRGHMRLAVSACWKLSTKDKLHDRSDVQKCAVCLFHSAQDRAIQTIEERT